MAKQKITPIQSPDLVKSVNRKDYTTNNTVTNQLIQTGWTYYTNPAARAVGGTITFPVAFDSVPIVVTSFAGLKTGAVPTGPGDTNGGYYDVVWSNAAGATTTTFIAECGYADAGNLPTGYSIITWIAIGTKAR
jgi:hypothetical protein